NEIISGELGLEKFLTNPEYAPGDAQAVMLAGDSKSLNGGIVEAAIENARICFALVGTAERFHESILLFAKTMGWKPPLFVNKNVTKLDDSAKADREKSTAKAHSLYQDYFKTDYLVYGAVDALLTRRIEEEGPAFRRALDGFLEIEANIAARATD